MVSTFKYKQEAQIDLKKSMEVTLQTMESQGAQNMIVKQEDYETKEGITGLKSYGTFSRINTTTNDKERIYYEILLFSHEGGLQQILILHQEGDKYANEISERVLSSVELKQEGR
ncbi:hypothetical protein D3C84_1112770 [compost metagenome]